MTLWEAQAVDGVTGLLRSVEGPWGPLPSRSSAACNYPVNAINCFQLLLSFADANNNKLVSWTSEIDCSSNL